MASLNLTKNHRDDPLEESDKDWTPPPHSNNRKKRTTEKSAKKGANVDAKSFQRLWSEEDEIVILERMIEYESKKNTSPAANYDVFYTFIKDKLQAEVNITQLKEKIRRIKRKYMKNIGKRSFAKPHEEKLFELSQRIWGDDRVDKEEGAAKVDDEVLKAGKMIVAKEKNSFCAGSSGSSLVLHGGSAADLEDWFRRNPGLISKEQRHEILKKSHSMKIARAEHQLNEITLMEEQVNLMTDALKASQE
ncbi:putative transcription factor At1g61730 [Nicotiana tabacum]|uniref:Transcription factor At1g61730 n=1 Tax=Nicotiana tabacum TaxID=4097 RepID=A0A1S4A186_TOBAC